MRVIVVYWKENMGYGFYLLMKVCLVIVIILSVYWILGGRLQFDFFWNNMRDWKRELVDKEGYFINIWVVEIDFVEEYVVVNIVKRYGFYIIGQVS